jgi:hypothetical protein
VFITERLKAIKADEKDPNLTKLLNLIGE